MNLNKSIIDEFLTEKKFNNKSELCSIMTKFGSDKGDRHNYTTFYYQIFNRFRDENLNIFEVGLGTNNPNIPSSMGVQGKPGASLKGWKEFFKNSMVYGADIDSNILFEEDRILTFYVNQLDIESINNMFSGILLNDIKFDLIIDDGLHEFEANKNFLENSFHKLKENGIYIIEDISEIYVDCFFKYIEKNKSEYKFIDMLTIPIKTDIQENNRLLLIQK